VPEPHEPRLELRGLSKRYGDKVALDDFSFEVGAGQMFGFVGPNGAGKTTTMRIVLGVLEADAGEVLWDGRPLDRETRRTIGYMPEERGLYPKMRVAEQLTYLAELHGIEPGEAAASAARWIERLGLEERAEDAVEELSLGNQQRVQLAAALVHGPRLLVLDEPFSGLDPVGVDVLSEVLLTEVRERGVPVVFSSHQLDLVERLCDAVAIIRDGRLVASGGIDELREQRGGDSLTDVFRAAVAG
jgi:ABC-2 type transport system ATP-binding protein